MKIKKERLQQAIQQQAERLFEETSTLREEKLFLTKSQYELDPEGWKKLIRQRGLPDTAIEIIPEVFKP